MGGFRGTWAEGPDQAKTIGGLSPDPDAANREQEIAVGQPPESNLFLSMWADSAGQIE